MELQITEYKKHMILQSNKIRMSHSTLLYPHRFFKGYNMFFHITYTDSRVGDESHNSIITDRVDVRKCYLHRLVFEIKEVYTVFKQNGN